MYKRWEGKIICQTPKSLGLRLSEVKSSTGREQAYLFGSLA
jgi:hypothetical protein